MRTRLNYKRAVGTFIAAYIAVTVLGIALSLSIGMVGHMPQSPEPLQNQAYLVAERFYPLLNLLVWGMLAWVYFRGRTKTDRVALRGEAFALGAFWMVAAIVVDYVGFVLIKNPISLTPHDFYIGQFPWIYLIYVAIFFAPLCEATFVRGSRRAAQPAL